MLEPGEIYETTGRLDGTEESNHPYYGNWISFPTGTKFFFIENKEEKYYFLILNNKNFNKISMKKEGNYYFFHKFLKIT